MSRSTSGLYREAVKKGELAGLSLISEVTTSLRTQQQPTEGSLSCDSREGELSYNARP